MAKQLNVDMRFTADTAKAKQAITELQTAIQKLGYGSNASNGKVIDPAQFEQASAAARELAYHLNNAYNAKTGNLDLSKLNASLKQSGTNLAQLTAGFKNAGETGQQAFIALARAVASADQPTITLNTQLSTMFTTLKNVARFQISSSIMHGLIGGVQQAYGYAKDLNESLNNIRIVTGQSSEQMARFAQEANKTARSLSATTLDYTNASLIYYQQGLDDNEVRDRTDVTIKMANVARESAETVSEQLTAIWNNFDDGSKSLEYYADVITALGAATASSSSEISAGLNKFAAVADTVGLSYENATAALATITATTRQSADTVGTGLRTLFSRLQGLSLGETLEDGVNLNKYSEALAKVGVQALDSSGNLRRMDEVLEDLGARWNDLTEAQQTALAQTVGGVRQYTTLVALMDNWDFMKQNQQIAAGAEGTLQEQADIYAEGWEAARDRVKAAIESLYDTLIDEDFFIGVDNVVEHILVGVKSFIDSFGGVKSLLVSVLSFVLSMTANKIGPAVQKVVQDIQIMTGGASQVYAKMQGEFNSAIDLEMASGQYSAVGEAELKSSQQLLLAKTKLGAVNDQLSASEKMRADLAIQGFQQQAKEIKRLADEQIKADEKVAQSKEKVTQAEEKAKAKAKSESDKANTKLTDANTRATTAKTQFEEDYGVSANDKMFTLGDKYIKQYSNVENFDEIKKSFQQIEDAAYESGIKIKDKLMDGFENSIRTGAGIDISTEMTQLFSADELMLPPDAADSLDQYKQKIEVLGASLGNVQEYAPNVADALRQISRAETPEEYNKALENLRSECAAVEIPASKVENALKNLGGNSKGIDNYTKALQNLKKAEEEAAKAQQHLTDVTNNSAATDEDVTQAKQELAEAEEKAKQAADDLTEAQNKQNAAVANFNPQHMVTGIEGITSAAAGFGQLAMTINSIKTLFNTWGDASTSLGEKLSATFMAISMAVPGLIGTFTSFSTVIEKVGQSQIVAAMGASKETAALTANNAEKAKSILLSTSLLTEEGRLAAVEQLVALGYSEAAAQDLVRNSVCTVGNVLKAARIALSKGEQAETAKETLAYIAENGALWAQVAARLALRVVENPALAAVMLGMIIATTAAIWANVAATKKQTQALKDEQQARKDAANSAKEQAEANRELVDSFESVLTAYEAAKAAGEDLTQIQADLASAARDVADAYHLEGEALAELTGNYDTFAKEVAEARNKEVQKTIDAAKEGQKAVGEEILNAAREGTGYIYGQYDDNGDQIGTGYKAHFGDGFLGGADDRAIATIVKSGDFKYLSKQADDNSINLNMSDFNAENLVAAYDEIGQVLAKARETMTDEELTKSETYQKMRDWYNKMTESAEQYKEYAQTIADLNIENKDRSGSMGIKSSDVKSLEDYQKLRSNLINSLKQEKGIVDENSEEFKEITASVDAYLGSLKSLSEFKLQNDAITDFNKISGGDIQKWTADNNVDLKVALQINPYLPESLWDEQIALIQAKADREKILVQIETIQTGKNLVGDSKTTTTDWVDWKESFSPEDWNNFLETSGFSDFSEFLVLSDEDKTKILNSYQDVLEQQAEAAREEVRTETEERKAANEAWLTGGSYEGGSFVTNEAKYQTAKSSNEYLENSMAAWNKKKSGETLTDSEVASIEGWDETIAQHVATQIEANNQIIQSYEGVQAAIDADSAALQRMVDEDAAQSTIGWLDDLKARLEDTDFKYDDIAEYAQYLKNAAKAGDGVAKSLEKQTQDSLELATKLSLLQKAIDKLHDNLDDYEDVLKGTNKGTKEYASQLSDLQDIMKDLVGTADLDPDGSIFDGKFFEQNAELFQKAAEGDREAIWELQKAAAEQIVLNIDNQGAVQEFQTAIEGLEALIPDDLEIGTSISEIEGTDAYLASLQALLAAGQITADEVNAALGAIGFEPEIVYVPISAVSSSTIGVAGGQDVDIGGQTVHVTSQAYESAQQQGMASIPVIVSSATRSSGRGGGGGIKLPTGGGKSGGGGGGGSKTTKEKKDPTDEKTRYHTITEKISDVTEAYDDLSRAEERAFGKEKSDLLVKQTKNLRKQIDLQKKYIDEIKDYLVGDQAAVADLGATFDENGVITNYDALIDDLVAKYNEGVEQFNAGLIDEDTFKTQFEDPYNDAMDAIDQYVESINLLQEQEYALGDMQDDLADKLREQIEYKVELHVELNEDDLKVIDYQLKHLGDDATDAMEKLELLGKKISITMDNINTYQKGINDLLSQHLNEAEMQDFYDGKLTTEDLKNKGFTEEDVNTLRDYRDKLLEANEALIEMREEMEGQFLATLDHYNEKIDKTQERFDQITKMAKHYKNIVDIVGKDKFGFDDKTLEALDATMVESANAKLESETKQLEELKKVQAQVEETLTSGDFGDHDREFWEKQLQEVTDRVHEQEEQWAQAFEDSVTAVRQKLENAIERATQKAKELAGLTDSVLKLKDFISNVDDITVGDADKMYQLTKLNREIEASIEGTNNNRSKKELLELQKKINNAMRDGQKYSQQDLDLLQKEFELKKAQLALEETENAKTTVRMSRDNEGNWGYVYTADEDQVDQAQQELDDKIYEYNKAIEETINHFADLGAEITQQYWDLRNEILLDANMTAEEQQRQLEILDAKYAEAMSEMTRETDFYTQQSAVLYEKQYVARAVALDIIKEANDEEVLSRANALQLLNEGEEDNVALARERLAQLTGDREVYYENIKKLGDEELVERATQLGLYSKQEAEELLKSEDGVEKLQTAIMGHYDETERQTLDQHARTLGLISDADKKGLEGQEKSTEELRKKILDHYKDIADGTGTYNEGIEGEISRHVSAVSGLQLTLQGNEDKVAEAFQATPQAQATGLGTMEEQISTYLTTSEGLVTASEKAMVDANDETKEAFEAAGTSVEDFHGDVQGFAEAMTGPGGEIETTKTAAEQLAEDMTEATKGVADFLKEWQEKYSERVGYIIDANTLLAKSVGDLLDKLSQVDDIQEDYGGSGSDDEGTGGGSDRTPTGGTGGGSGSGESGGGGSGSGESGGGGVYVTSTSGWKHNATEHWKVRTYSNGNTEIIDKDTHANHWNYATEGWKTCSVCGYYEKLTGCFPAGTLIMMEDFSEKRIEEIKAGDKVISYNLKNNTFEKKEVIFAFSLFTNVLVDIVLSNGNILHTTLGHPLLTPSGWKSLSPELSLKEHKVQTTLLSIGDILFGCDIVVTVEKIIQHSGIFQVYDFTIGDNHTFIAEHLIVHNMAAYDAYSKYKTGGYTGTWSAVSGRTGMYTGSWNGPDIEPNGRLAFLHQKELVLNADDTQNMLTAVKYVREIANMIDLSAGMRSRGIGEITPWISDMPKEEKIEQEVHIEASFPSVVSHSEIEEAFKNIIGKASQFAYRK